jgi:hypothetical protein
MILSVVATFPNPQEEFVTTYQGRHYPPFFRGESLPWLGITYPVLFTFSPLRSAWSRLMCPRGWHLFDEVHSMEFGHRLSCDACDLSVAIGPEPTLEEVLRAEGLPGSSQS